MSNTTIIIVLVTIALLSTAFFLNTSNKFDSRSDGCIIDIKKTPTMTILELLKYAAEAHPKVTALKFKQDKKWKSVSYAEYYVKTKNFAQSVNHWLGSEVNIATLGFNSTGWFYAHLGCMLNGGKSIGIYTTASSDTCKYIIMHSHVELLVVQNDYQLDKFSEWANDDNFPIKMIVYYAPISKKVIDKFPPNIPIVSMGVFMADTSKLENIPKVNDVATIIYTSGTTGDPKGVCVTHANIMASIVQMIVTYKTKSLVKKIGYEQLISYLPLNHIAAQMVDIYFPIATLSTVWFADDDALKSSLAKTIKEVRPTMFGGIPRVWEKIQEGIDERVKKEGVKGLIVKYITPWKIKDAIGFDKCILATSIAAPMPENTKTQLHKYGIDIYDIYGMSETSGPISVSAPGLARPHSTGFPTMQVKIAKDGEIVVKGTNVFYGYYKDTKLTKKSYTKDGWFKTGDIGKLDTSGFLYVTGRKKELIVTAGGENIAPSPIESALRTKIGHIYNNIMVIGDGRKYLTVLLNSEKGMGEDPEIILNAINYANNIAPNNASTIKKHVVIKTKFKIGDELTPTLKLRRFFVENKYANEIDKMYR